MRRDEFDLSKDQLDPKENDLLEATKGSQEELQDFKKQVTIITLTEEEKDEIRKTWEEKDDGKTYADYVNEELAKKKQEELETTQWGLDVTTLGEINNIRNDIKLEAAFKLLYAGGNKDLYVGIEKGSEMEKFVLSHGWKLENGDKLKISAAVLNKLVAFHVHELNKTEKVDMTQYALGAEYTQDFTKFDEMDVDGKALFDQIKYSLSFFTVDNEHVGDMGAMAEETAERFDQYNVMGAVAGGNVLVAEAVGVMSLSEKLKLYPSFGAYMMHKNSMAELNHTGDDKVGVEAGIKAGYEINDNNDVSAGYKWREDKQEAFAKIEHQFTKELTGHVTASKTWREGDLEDEERLMAGMTYKFGAGNKDALDGVTPMRSIDTDEIQVDIEEVIFKEHTIGIDLTKLPAGSYLEKNNDGTLKSINLNIVGGMGGDKLDYMVSINHGEFKDFFEIVDGEYLRIKNFENLAVPATYTFVMATKNGGEVVVTFKTTEGSVELVVEPKITYQQPEKPEAPVEEPLVEEPDPEEPDPEETDETEETEETDESDVTCGALDGTEEGETCISGGETEESAEEDESGEETGETGETRETWSTGD